MGSLSVPSNCSQELFPKFQDLKKTSQELLYFLGEQLGTTLAC